MAGRAVSEGERLQRTLESLRKDPQAVQRMLDDALKGGNPDEISFAYRVWRESRR